MRAFRPSAFGREDEVDEEVERAKQANMLQYTQRAQAGLPLFETLKFAEANAAAVHLPAKQ
ncbi:MAG: hypothetical protein ACE15C_00295 [Phycisphaerae bacterium]